MKKDVEMYELVLLLKFTLTEQEVLKKLDYYKNFLTLKGSQVMSKIHGKKSLAYSIQGFDTSISIQLIYLGNGNLVKLLNTELQRDENILRAITTKLVNKNLSEDSNFLPKPI